MKPSYKYRCPKCGKNYILFKNMDEEFTILETTCECGYILTRDYSAESKSYNGLNEVFNKSMEPRFDYTKRKKKLF